MARSDHIVELVRAGVRGDTVAARKTAEAIAAEERARKHEGVADRINRALVSAELDRTNRINGSPISRGRDASGAICRTEARRRLDQIYLKTGVRDACKELIEEQIRADLLRSHGIEPRHRVLLIGPPGNGKTSLAEALAYETALPLLTVRYEAVITSYLGETAKRLKRLFDYVKTEPCVLFFDEFDAIGKERGDIHETGEIKRLVTSLLLQVDELPTYCILVCATNHPELLDRATWRRFELRLTLAKPTQKEMCEFIDNNLSSFSEDAGINADKLRSALKPACYSEAESFFLDVRRRAILNHEASLSSIIREREQAWTSRKRFAQAHSQQGKTAAS